jgi:hypothetical protein
MKIAENQQEPQGTIQGICWQAWKAIGKTSLENRKGREKSEKFQTLKWEDCSEKVTRVDEISYDVTQKVFVFLFFCIASMIEPQSEGARFSHNYSLSCTLSPNFRHSLRTFTSLFTFFLGTFFLYLNFLSGIDNNRKAPVMLLEHDGGRFCMNTSNTRTTTLTSTFSLVS